MKNNLNEKVETILSVAKVLAENGATTDRIIRAVDRIATSFEVPAGSFTLQVQPSILFMNIFDGEKFQLYSKTYDKNHVNFKILTAISRLTHKVAEKNYSVEEFQQLFDRLIKNLQTYPTWQKILAAGTACGGLCVLFGGDFQAVIYTLICASVAKFFQLQIAKTGLNEILLIALTSFIATICALLANFFSDRNSLVADDELHAVFNSGRAAHKLNNRHV